MEDFVVQAQDRQKNASVIPSAQFRSEKESDDAMMGIKKDEPDDDEDGDAPCSFSP